MIIVEIYCNTKEHLATVLSKWVGWTARLSIYVEGQMASLAREKRHLAMTSQKACGEGRSHDNS